MNKSISGVPGAESETPNLKSRSLDKRTGTKEQESFLKEVFLLLLFCLLFSVFLVDFSVGNLCSPKLH